MGGRGLGCYGTRVGLLRGRDRRVQGSVGLVTGPVDGEVDLRFVCLCITYKPRWKCVL